MLTHYWQHAVHHDRNQTPYLCSESKRIVTIIITTFTKAYHYHVHSLSHTTELLQGYRTKSIRFIVKNMHIVVHGIKLHQIKNYNTVFFWQTGLFTTGLVHETLPGRAGTHVV